MMEIKGQRIKSTYSTKAKEREIEPTTPRSPTSADTITNTDTEYDPVC